MAWIRTFDSDGAVFSLGHGTSADELVLKVANGKIGIYNHKAIGQFNERLSETSVNNGQWLHVAGVLVDGGGLENLKVYVNGMEETGTVRISGTPTDIVDTTPRQGIIGWRTSMIAGEAYVGTIDEVMLFNRALTGGEIQAIFDAGAQGICRVPDIAVDPATKAYGNVLVGSSASQTFEVSNEGNDDLNVTSTTLIGTDPGQFSIDNGGGAFTLAPGETRNIDVSFNPTSVGLKTVTLRIASNDPDENPKDVALNGIGGGFPDIAVDPDSKDYGSVRVGSSATQNFVVANNGATDLNVTSTTLMGADAGHFSIENGGGPFTVLPGATRDVQVNFNPTSESTKSASLRMISNDPDESPFDVPLSGKGEVQTECDQPPSGIMAWWPGDGNTDDIVGSNDGTAENGLSYGTGFVDQAFHFDGADDYFSVNPDLLTGATAVTIEGWIYLKSYATTGQSTIVIDRTPSSADFQFAVTPDDNTPHKVFFHLWTTGGTAMARSTSDIPLSTWTHVAGVYDGSQISVYINGSQDGSIGTTSGAIPSNSNNLWIGDDHWNPSFDGMMDELKAFDRALTPSEIQSIYAAGSYGVCKVPDIAVNPTTKDYGSVVVGSSASQTFVVTNEGNGDLNVTNMDLVGSHSGEFSIDSGGGGFSLIPGATQDIQVSFNPTSESSKSASLRIVSNDPDESPLDIPLSGKGESPTGCSEPPSGLVVWWPGDGDTQDIVGSKNGTSQNGANFADGKVDQAFQFDGNDDYMIHGLSLPRQTGTIEHWLLPHSESDRRHMVAYYESNGTSTDHNGLGDISDSILEIHTGLHHNNNYVFYFQDGGTYYSISGGSVVKGEWAHLVATWDRAGSMILYVNGEQVASRDLSSIAFEGYTPTVRQFGQTGNQDPERSWHGLIDEVAVYNRALNAAEIAAIYAAGSAGKCKEGVGPDVDLNLPMGYTGSVFTDNIASMETFTYSPSGDFDNYLYITVQGSGFDKYNIIRFDNTGTESSFATHITEGGQWSDNRPNAMAIDPWGKFDHHMYLTSGIAIGKASSGYQDDDAIIRVQSDGSASRFHITNVTAYNGKMNLAFAPCGDFASNLYLTNQGSRTVDRIEPDGSGGTLVTLDAGTRPGGIVFDDQGKSVYVADYGDDKILKIDAEGTVATFVDDIPDIVDLAWDRTGRFGFDLFATSYTPSTPGANEGRIFRIHSNGTFETFATGLAFQDADRPELVFVFDGDLFILETGKNRILRVESSNNSSTIPIMPVVSSPQAVGQEFWVDVQVGEQANPVSNLFGVSFSLQYTHTEFVDVLTPHYANVINGDFLGNDLVFSQTVTETGGKIDVGVSRKAGAGGVDGQGTILRAKFRLLPGIPSDTEVRFSISDMTANDPTGSSISLISSGACVAIQSGVPVWPGDTNNNGLVDQGDVLPLGLYWNQTGPAREDRSIQWSAQSATPWTIEAATYADADGNGEVNEADVLPIGFNWGKTHGAFMQMVQNGNDPQHLGTGQSGKLILEFFNDPVTEAYFAEIRVEEVEDLFGLAFNLAPEAESGLIPQSVEMSSWMGPDMVTFVRIDTALSRVSIGLSHTINRSGVEGSGLIARVLMFFFDGMPSSELVRFRMEDVVAIDHSGRSLTLDVIVKSFTITDMNSHEEGEVPTEFALGQNAPNPFNPTTTITYEIPKSSRVTLEIYNLLGARIRTLVNTQKEPGRYTVQWDTRDEYGLPVSGGMYLYRMQAGSYFEVRKMLLIR